jgi:SAM-dependent methyltransferase
MSAPCPSCGCPSAPEGRQLGGHAIVVCTGCTLRFAPTAWGLPVDYEQIYDSPEYLATQVDVLSADFDPAQFVKHGTYRHFFEQAPARPGAALLDLGCGVGRFCHAAHSVGWRVVGADVSEKAVEAGRKRAPFPLRHATAEELVSGQERFDAVTAFEVLEHLARPKEFLQQAGALTTPGGIVFCTVPNWDCELVQTATRPDWIPPVHLNFFTERALGRLAELAGLGAIKTGVIRADPPRLSWKRRLVRLGRGPGPQQGQALGLWLLAQHTTK